MDRNTNAAADRPRKNMKTAADVQQKDTDNPHDKGYKLIFSIKKNFLDFIKKYIGFEWMIELTEDELELVDKEYITDQFDTYESDLVYKVQAGNRSVYLFFLFELQSSNDFTMPFRLLVYMTAIWLDYFKNCDKDKRKQKGYRLPAIMPVVLYNGEKRWTASRRFRELVGDADLFGDYIIDFEYIFVSVGQLSEAEIKASNTLVDNIFLADQKRTKRDWFDGFGEMVQRVRMMDTADLNKWVTWFSHATRTLDKDERDNFITQIKEGDEKVMCSSFERILIKEREIGERQGKKIGKAKSVIELLEDLGEVPETLREIIMAQENAETLSQWLKLAAKAESIEAFAQAVGIMTVH